MGCYDDYSTLRSSGIYLDIGCGTGLVGESISCGESNSILIDGCDCSQEMLSIAKSKNIYRALVRCNIFDMPYADCTYDVAIAAGIFASNEDYRKAGYANSQALPGVIRVIKPFGYCIFSVSSRVWETDGQNYEEAISQLPVSLIQKLEQPYHDAIPKMFNVVLQKIEN